MKTTAPRAPEKLVEQQVQRWSASSRAASKAGGRVGPVVAIGRQYGTPASEIGRELASRLGYSFWDREILEVMAREAHVSPSILEPLDEQTRGNFASLVYGAFDGVTLNEDDYRRYLTSAVQQIARAGRAVFVGRGVQYLTAAEWTLRVLIVAPLSTRMQHIVSTGQADPGKAEQRLHEVDRERAAFLRRHFGKNADQPDDYDLIINAASFSAPQAAGALAAALRERFGQA